MQLPIEGHTAEYELGVGGRQKSGRKGGEREKGKKEGKHPSL